MSAALHPLASALADNASAASGPDVPIAPTPSQPFSPQASSVPAPSLALSPTTTKLSQIRETDDQIEAQLDRELQLAEAKGTRFVGHLIV